MFTWIVYTRVMFTWIMYTCLHVLCIYVSRSIAYRIKYNLYDVEVSTSNCFHGCEFTIICKTTNSVIYTLP